MKGRLKTLAIWLIIAVIFIVLLTSVIDNANTKMSYSDLLNKMELGEVKQIELNSGGKSAYVKLDGESNTKEVNIPSLESFMNYSNNLIKDGKITLTEKSE